MNKVDRYKILIRHLISLGVVANQKELGVKLGYNNESAFSQLINGKVVEPKNFTEKLKSLVPNLNLDWLESGEGAMIINLDDSYTGEQHFHGDINGNNPQFAGRDISNTGGEFDKFISALTAQADLTKEAHDLTRRAQVQVDKAQAQIDRLITIIELKLNIASL